MWQRLSCFAVLLTVSVGVVSAPASRACACSCLALSPGQAAQLAEVVFDGVVLTVDGRAGDGTGEPVRVRFAVDEVRKGPRTDRIELTTASNSAACGFDFQPGQRYRVYADGGTTGLCSGNQLLGPAAAQPRGGPAESGAPAPAQPLTPPASASPLTDDAVPAGSDRVAERSATATRTGGAPVLIGAVGAGVLLLGGALLGWLLRRRRAQKSA